MTTTNTLSLLPVERTHKEAFGRSKAELAALLRVRVPDSWPSFPEAFSLPADEPVETTPTHWSGYFFIHQKNQALVGNGGFKGPPDEHGVVEIGYEIASEYWNRGFATEAVRHLLSYAFAHQEVQAVIAHTLGEKNASNSVLQKVGMTFDGELADPDIGKLWRWQLRRDAYRPM